jgi:hypothetical protein
MQVLLYLDVDGVLNAPGQAKAWGDTPQTGTVSVNPDWRNPDSQPIEVDVSWSPRAITAVRDLISSPGVIPVFLSSWGIFATTTFAPLVGLPDNVRYATPPQPSDYDYAPGGMWKSSWLLGNIHVGAGPLAIVDDHLTGGEAAELHRRAKESDVPLRIVAPDSSVGITPRDLRGLRAWVRRHAA